MCGQVKMRITKAPLFSAACHCDGCQKMSSSAYSLTMMIPSGGFEVEGETDVGALHRPQIQHHHCTLCKNWLFTTGELLGGNVNFRPTMLEDAKWVRPYLETWTLEKLPGVSTGATLSFDRFPPAESLGDLIRAHAREGARPA